MEIMLRTCLLICLLVGLETSNAQRPDFGGDWVRHSIAFAARSDPELLDWLKREKYLNVSQTSVELVVTRSLGSDNAATVPSPEVKDTTQKDVVLDRHMGPEKKFTLGAKGEGAFRWSGSHLILHRVLEALYKGRSIKMHAEEEWGLSFDSKLGTVLIIHLSIGTPGGNRNYQLTYKRLQ